MWVTVGISSNFISYWGARLMKNVIVLVVFILCFCWACKLQAQNGGKTLHILYSGDERGAITPCG